jgi:hypothetical protein
VEEEEEEEEEEGTSRSTTSAIGGPAVMPNNAPLLKKRFFPIRRALFSVNGSSWRGKSERSKPQRAEESETASVR